MIKFFGKVILFEEEKSFGARHARQLTKIFFGRGQP